MAILPNNIFHVKYKIDMQITRVSYGKVFAIITGIIVIGIVGFLAFTLTQNIEITSSEITYKRQAEVLNFDAPPNGSTAIGTLKDGVKIVYGGDNPRPTASMAKVITSLVALDQDPQLVDKVFTITARDVERYSREIVRNGSRLLVVEGEELSGRQAIEALMIVSANNIADSLARWVFEDFDSYKIAAEKWLEKNDLTNTTIGSDASGFDPGTASTPSDMIKIGQLALENEVLREIVIQQSANFPFVGEEINTNKLLSEGYIGIKTGNSDQALSCLLFAREHNNDIIIGVIMGQPFNSTFDATRQIWASLDQNFSEITIPANTVVGRYILPWGGEVEVATVENLVAKDWRDVQPEIILNPINLNTNHRSRVGTITLGDQAVNLRINNIVENPSIFWRLQNLFQK
jgi:D-alanyl-D-alanine carboxypeptidase